MSFPPHFLKISDVSAEQLKQLHTTTDEFKSNPNRSSTLRNHTIALLFEKPSTRTRVSFEVGISELGGTPVPLNANEIQISRGEPVRDTARVLSRYVDGVVARVYDHRSLTEFASFGTIPVINGLSNFTHPCQVLSDLFTIREKKANKEGSILITYAGDGNNVCHSLLLGVALAGMDLRVAHPKEYGPDPEVVEEARTIAASTGASIHLTTSAQEAAEGADVLYTDVWASMGDEDEKEKRKQAFQNMQINRTLLNRADPDAIVMHCLPAYRGEEITEDVLEGKQSVVWDQAENRLHAQKSLLHHMFTN